MVTDVFKLPLDVWAAALTDLQRKVWHFGNCLP
jgi:hypothetical protein